MTRPRVQSCSVAAQETWFRSDMGVYSDQASLTESCAKHWMTMKVVSASGDGLLQTSALQMTLS